MMYYIDVHIIMYKTILEKDFKVCPGHTHEIHTYTTIHNCNNVG